MLKNSHHHSSGRYRVEGPPQENTDRSSTGGGREGDGQEAGVLREQKKGKTHFFVINQSIRVLSKTGTPKCYLDYINHLLGFSSQQPNENSHLG